MAYEPSTNLDFIATDVNCDAKAPQPAFDTVTTTTDGWRAITYRDYNGDYNPKQYDSVTDKVVQDYSPRDVNNQVKVVQEYKSSKQSIDSPVN